MECRTFAVYDGGDHSIVVGQVAAGGRARPGPATPRCCSRPYPARGPLIHHAGRYRRLRPTED